MLTPRARIPPFVEIPQQQDKSYKRSYQSSRANEPPRPPQRLAALEEAHGRFCKVGELLRHLARGSERLRINGCVGWFVVSDAFAQGLRGVEEADTEDESHEESTDMREVVEAREETEDEGDGDVEEDEDEVFDGRAAGGPCVEEVEQREC